MLAAQALRPEGLSYRSVFGNKTGCGGTRGGVTRNGFVSEVFVVAVRQAA